MKLILLINILFLFSIITILPQQTLECGTRVPFGIIPEQVESNNLQLYENNTTYTLRLAIHIIKFQDGSGGITEENLQNKLDTLNELMAQADFQFYEYKRDYILSDYFANLDTTKLNELFSTYYIDGCINVYFVPIFTEKGWGTFSSRFGNTPQGIAVYNYAHQTTLAHEIGHYFDLLHTDQIWEVEEIPGVTVTIIENIDRVGPCKNCYSAGDLLCDTPADPSIRFKGGNLVDTNCNWNTNNNYPPDECNRTDYNPLTDNLMTTQLYYHCRRTLTSQQKQRMKQTLLDYRDKLLKHSVYLANSNENLNLGGSLHINSEDYLSGENGFVETGQYNVGTNNERFSNSIYYKHKYWNENQQDYFLSRVISIENDEEQIAKFSELKQVVIRNIIDGMSFNDQLPVWFSDPWYVFDENDNQLGMGNYITPRPLSPYQPTGKYSYTTGGVFLNQGITPQGQWQSPYYSVKADAVQDIQLQQTGRTHRFYFQNWSASPQGNAEFQDANALETPVVFKQEGATVQANLKGTQLSNNSNAYSKGSQRKFIRITNGRLFSVYESMGNIYLERSTDNGASWHIITQGNRQKLNDNEANSPSMDYYKISDSQGELVLITFVEKDSLPDLASVVVVGITDKLGLPILFKQEVAEIDENLLYNSNPSIATAGNGKFIVVFKGYDASNGKFHFRRGVINNLQLSWVEQNTYDLPVVQNSNSYSINPTIAEDRNTAGVSYQLAWEQSGAIRYCKLVEDANGNITQTNHSVISNGSSYIFHSSPSIVAIGNGARVCWLGWNDEDPVVSAVVFKDPANSRFWSFGSNVSRPNINKSNDNTYYAFAWSQNNSTVKFADCNLNSVYEIIGIPGKDVQISNGNGKTNMYANIFKATSQPYFFTMSYNLNHYYSIQKSNGLVVSNGRAGVLRKNGGEIYFALGDITIDDQKVGFVECSPEVDISNVNLLNQYLETEPFEVTDNSGLVYTVQYGIVDSSTISGMFSQGEQVRFKVELVDINTGQVLGVFDDVVYDQNNLTDFENILYQVNTQGIGQRTVKLRLRIEETITPEVSMVDRIDNGSALAKGKKKELNYQGETIPKEFALSQNYPNPFNPTTVISWQSPVASHQTLKVYDILGNEVVTLVDEHREAGRYKVEFDASSLASGVYIYKLTAGSFVSSKKMMVVK